MATDDKICMVCGKHHKYCANDVRYNKDETWRNLYCSGECRKIFGVYKDIKDGKLSGDAASKAALKMGLAKIMGIKEPMRSVLISYAKKFKPAKAEPNIQSKPSQPRPKTNNTKSSSNNRRRTNNNKQKDN